MNDTSTMSDLVTTEVADLTKEGHLRYVIVPFIVIIIIILLTALAYYMARKRKLDNLRHRLMPLYNFDKNEQESDWETEFLNTVENPNYTAYETSFRRYED